MQTPLYSYRFSLDHWDYDVLCALPGVIEEYAAVQKGARSVVATMRDDFAALPVDPATGHRIFELVPDDQEMISRLLDWAAKHSGDRNFGDLAAGLREAAAESDRRIRDSSQWN